MRVVIAMMKHETNTFSPVPTDWARFEAWGAYFGKDVIAAYEHTNMTLGAYIRLAREAGAELVTPIAAEAMPSGPVSAQAYARMSDAILEAVAAGPDAIMLDLHGAMVAETTSDGEGTLLTRIRALAPRTPVCVTLDLHANLTQAMVANCDCLIGYKTYPHVDMFEVGTQIGRILFDLLRGRARPVMAWRRLPLLSQTLRQGTDDEPMRSLIRAARAEEANGLLAASVFGGFALADIEHAGASAVCVAEGRRDSAEAALARILARYWDARAECVYRGRPLAETVAEAKRLPDGPVILLDHADNVGSGGTQDVMTAIAEVERQGLSDVAVAAVWDPAAVAAMARAGVGATLALPLGGKTDMPALGLPGRPLVLTGKVKLFSDGEFVVRGPMYHGLKVSLGRAAVFDTGRMEIVVVSRHHEPWDRGVFTSLGIDPASKKYLLLKSRIHYRAGFAELARHTLTLDGEGVTTSDNRLLDYRRVRRPIYPLDQVNDPMA
ncbi:MAG: M81 family metallopeptidase [Alphaproteobacteria bacterium]|nr:M81 family metallopeptidase [Alphaproteobacteria bacterium]